MAVTEAMEVLALKLRPHAACLVPERREEVTTEGGLDLAGGFDRIAPVVRRLSGAGVRVSCFIDARDDQVDAAAAAGAQVVEFTTGPYCDAVRAGDPAPPSPLAPPAPPPPPAPAPPPPPPHTRPLVHRAGSPIS